MGVGEPVTQTGVTPSGHANELAGQGVIDVGLKLKPVPGLGDRLHSAVQKLNLNLKEIPDHCRSKESLSQCRPALKARNYANLPL